MKWYSAGRVGHEYWAVITPHGATEEVISGQDAESRVRSIVAERNEELYRDRNPQIPREHDRHQHGDLVIITERRPDGTLDVRVNPGKEKIELHLV